MALCMQDNELSDEDDYLDFSDIPAVNDLCRYLDNRKEMDDELSVVDLGSSTTTQAAVSDSKSGTSGAVSQKRPETPSCERSGFPPGVFFYNRVDDAPIYPPLSPLYKTRLCKFHANGTCQNGATCSFAHGPQDLRVSPDFERTALCPFMQKSGVCWEPGCRYAHNMEEIQTAGLLKTKMCRFYLNGHCVVGKACRFAHTLRELREAELVQNMKAAAPVQLPEEPNARCDIHTTPQAGEPIYQ